MLITNFLKGFRRGYAKSVAEHGGFKKNFWEAYNKSRNKETNWARDTNYYQNRYKEDD